MTYTKEMYGMPSTKPGPGGDYYQASRKPPGALAVQCALGKSAAEVQEWREEEFNARVDDIKRLEARNPVKKLGPAAKVLLRGLGLGSAVDRQGESAYVQALRSMPNYEPLDKKQRARLLEMTHYPFHTKESAKALEADMARRKHLRDKENAYTYFDDAASRSEYEIYVNGSELNRRRKFTHRLESLSERQSRMVFDAVQELKRVAQPFKVKLLAMQDSGVDRTSAEYRLVHRRLLAVVKALNGPALIAAQAKEVESLRAQKEKYLFKSAIEATDLDECPEYITYDSMPKEEQIAWFKDIVARYNRGQRLSNHELKLYALALENQVSERKAINKDIAAKSSDIVWIETRERPFSTSPRQSPQKTSDGPPGDEPPKKVAIRAISGPRFIRCFEIRPFVPNAYEEMCRKAHVEARVSSFKHGFTAAQSEPKSRLKNWPRLLRKEPVKTIDSDEYSMHSSISMCEKEQPALEDHGIDNYKPLPLISPAKNNDLEISDFDFSFDGKEEFSDDDFMTDSSTMYNDSEAVEETGDDFSFDMEKKSEIDVESSYRMMEDVPETLETTSLHEYEEIFFEECHKDRRHTC